MARKLLEVQKMTEAQSQQALVRWCKMMHLPIVHVPNEGKRSYATAVWLESMGCWWGCADLFLAKSCGGSHGYWVEMKAPGKRPNEAQMAFLEAMRGEGYKADWFDDWEKAKKAIEEYLAGR